VRFAGITHPGLIGTAPSQELLDIWNEREGGLVATGELELALTKCLQTRPLGARARARPHDRHTRAPLLAHRDAALRQRAARSPLHLLTAPRLPRPDLPITLVALLPEPKGALLGAIKAGSPDFDRIAAQAARTIPGRENGGNCASLVPSPAFWACCRGARCGFVLLSAAAASFKPPIL
jgi:formamidase